MARITKYDRRLISMVCDKRNRLSLLKVSTIAEDISTDNMQQNHSVQTRPPPRWRYLIVTAAAYAYYFISFYMYKAPSTPETISKQLCRMLQVKRFFRQSRTLLCHVCRFGNNVERNFVLSTKSKQIDHVQFVSTLSKRRNFTKNSFDIVAKTATIWK